MRRVLPPVHALLCAITCALPGVPARRAQAADAEFWQRALSATEEQRHADVVAALEPVRDDVRGARGSLLLALALAWLERYEDALAALPEAAARQSWPAAVRGQLDQRRRHWAARAGQCDAVGEVGADDDASLRVAAARCALAAAEPGRALTLLKGLSRVDARELNAQALAESGDEGASLAEVRALWLAQPAHGHAARWEERLRAADPALRLSEAEHLARAEAWLDARRFDAAVRELEGLADKGERRQRARLWHLRGTALYRTRKHYPEAAKALARAARLAGATEASDAFHAARAYSRAGQNERAIRDYRRFAKRYPKSQHVAEALYLAAWLEARQGRSKSASRALARLADDPVLQGAPGLRTKVLWELGWQAHERKQHRLAARYLARYAEAADSGLSRARGHYWAGVSLARGGARPEALEALTQAAHSEPLGYYALLATRRAQALGLGEIPPFPEPVSDDHLPRPDIALPEATRFYAALSLTQLAAESLPRDFGAGPEARVAALLATGDAESAHRAADALSEALWRQPPSEANRWLWAALYPRPFRAAVQSQCEAHGLPASLLYAHMLVESRFDPSAVSGAGARGLLQLMPATAARVAESLGEQADDERLLNPAFNVTLGAAYLAGLLSQYGGAYPAAIAAYNAGRGHVDSWLAKPGELDEWVERIPIQQTRNYVRRVLSHWARYRYLEAPDAWQPPVPERMGDLK